MAALKLELCLARRQGAGSPQTFPKINIPPLNKWLRRIKNMYKSEQYFESIYSYKKVLLLLTTSPYKMSLHTLLSFFFVFYPAGFFLFFMCSITTSCAYKKHQKDNFDGLIKWFGTSKLLQNEHLKIYNFAFWVPCYKVPALGGSL